MFRYAFKRLLMLIPIILCASLLLFTLVNSIPGDPAALILGEDSTETAKAELREQLGLHNPFLVRYINYLKDLLHGDLGDSYYSREAVTVDLGIRLPNTIKLSLMAGLLSVLVGVSIGIISAIRQYSWIDNIGTAFALFGASAPSFWTALLFIILFSIRLDWLPSSGLYGPSYWILPVATLGLQQGSVIMRFTRSAMLDIIRQDYVRTAYAVGEAEHQVIFKHILRNALMPIITAVGLCMCSMLTGAILVESVFSIPGIGKYLIDSVYRRDQPAIMSTVLIISIMCAVVNLIVDLLYAAVDPKIATMYAKKKRDKEAE